MEPRDDTNRRPAPDGRAEGRGRPPAPRTRLALERLEERVAPSHLHTIPWYIEHHVTPPHFYW
jgi:hypothetical protein